MNSHVLKAAEAVGGQAALARILDVTPASVNHWITGMRPVPAERCPEIERAANGVVRCEDLRPDVAWEVLRLKVAPVTEGAPPVPSASEINSASTAVP